MKCKNHPDKDAVAICEKFGVGYCAGCCESEKIEEDHPLCYCTSPNVHCKFRPQCIVYHQSKKRSREKKSRES